jgi:hypothetical protein
MDMTAEGENDLRLGRKRADRGQGFAEVDSI